MNIRKLEEYMHKIADFESTFSTIIARVSMLEDEISKKADFSNVHALIDGVKSELIIRAREKGIDL